jgi:flagellar motor switch protein FliG
MVAGREAAKSILTEAVGGVRARNILDRLDIPQTERFNFVGDNDLENLGYFLENQLPQIAAVTLLHLRQEHAHKVLEMFPPKFKAEIVSRMVGIDKVDRRMVQMLSETLEQHLILSRDLVNLHGSLGATDLLKLIPPTSQQEVLAAIGETDSELRAEIEKGLVTFDDLATIEDRDFAQLINRVRGSDREVLPLALKSCSEVMRSKIFDNMTSTIREEVEYRLETMQRRRITEVEEAQLKIVQIAVQMSEEGVFPFGGTEELV